MSFTGVAEEVQGSSCNVALMSVAILAFIIILFLAAFTVFLGVYALKLRKKSAEEKTSMKETVKSARVIDCEKSVAYNVTITGHRVLPLQSTESSNKKQRDVKVARHSKSKTANDPECKRNISHEGVVGNAWNIASKNNVRACNDLATTLKKNKGLVKHMEYKENKDYGLTAEVKSKKSSKHDMDCRENRAYEGGIAVNTHKKNKTKFLPVLDMECRENNMAYGGGIASGKKNKTKCSSVPAVDCRGNIAYRGAIATGKPRKNKTTCSPVLDVECRENKAYGGVGAGYKVIREVALALQEVSGSSDVSVSPNEAHKLRKVTKCK